MASVRRLRSAANPVFKRFHALAHSSRQRRVQGLSLLDGANLIRAALECGWPLQEFIVSETGLQRAEIASLLQCASEIACTEVTDELFRRISPVETPSGLLALVAIPSSHPLQLNDGESLLVLDHIQDSGNLGTIVRTAAAAGIKQVLLSPGCAQAWSPRALRAGMGGHFCVELHEQVALTQLKTLLQGYRGHVVATLLSERTLPLYSLDFGGAVAWLFGGEGAGLSPSMTALASHHVSIPMLGAVESLNVAAAVAVCLFEQLRQRRAAERNA